MTNEKTASAEMMDAEMPDAAQTVSGEDEEEALCRDIQMSLPDDFWALDYVSRYRFGRFTKDFALADDGRAFLFGVVEVPLLDEPGSFTWGIWAEVSRAFHDRYLECFQTEAAEGLCAEGRLANEVPGYDDAFGTRLQIELHADRRPTVTMLEGSLAEAQQTGLTLEAHRALDEVLFPPEDDVDDAFDDELEDDWADEPERDRG